jgi:hypothetical protein
VQEAGESEARKAGEERLRQGRAAGKARGSRLSLLMAVRRPLPIQSPSPCFLGLLLLAAPPHRQLAGRVSSQHVVSSEAFVDFPDCPAISHHPTNQPPTFSNRVF